MSAPVTERPRGGVAGGVRTAPRPSRAPAPTIPAQRGAPTTRGGPAQRAYARRDERLRRLVDGVRPASGRKARGGTPRRAQFVLLVMVLLAAGLVLTLWLSTAAAADSYRLQDARAEAGRLTEVTEDLRREVAVMASAPELARRAGELGMVPVQDPARIVVGADGTVTVFGEPQVARAPAPPVVPAPPAPAEGAAPVEEAPTEAGSPPAADTDATPDDPAAEDQAVEEQAAEEQVADEQVADEQVADEQVVDDEGADDEGADEAAAAGDPVDPAADATTATD